MRNIKPAKRIIAILIIIPKTIFDDFGHLSGFGSSSPCISNLHSKSLSLSILFYIKNNK